MVFNDHKTQETWWLTPLCSLKMVGELLQPDGKT
jgi:hypothetical protein